MGGFRTRARCAAIGFAMVVGCAGEASAPAVPGAVAVAPVPAAAVAPMPAAGGATVAPVPAPAVVGNAPTSPVAAPAAAGVVAATEAVLGTGDPIAFAHAPPAGVALHAPLEAPWDAVRALLAAATPISRGTRVGYRPIRDDGELAGAPTTFATRGAHTFLVPTWWRSGATTLLVVPYLLPGERGGIGTALFEPAPGGLRYATHVPEQPIDQACTSSASAWAITADGTELQMLTGCVDHVPTMTTFRVAGASIAVSSGGVGPTGAPMDGAMRDPRVAPPAPPPRPTIEPSSRDELLRAALCCVLPDEEGCPPVDDGRSCAILGSRPRCDDCMTQLQEDGWVAGDKLAQVERSCGAACR